MSREQAEALTQHLTGVLCANREKLEELFVAKVTLEKVGDGTVVPPYCLPCTAACMEDPCV